MPGPHEMALTYAAERRAVAMTTTQLSHAVAKATPLPQSGVADWDIPLELDICKGLDLRPGREPGPGWRFSSPPDARFRARERTVGVSVSPAYARSLAQRQQPVHRL
ncbi:hypothetical protein [Nonomuraea roseola]|uniref:Uncharacterized protein n=1 Tax=Nonomuraea roseola TaxID=46179 RepID=A0ABV5PTQ2_9ACTN